MAMQKQAKETLWALPPLILHPFSNASDPVRLLANPKTGIPSPAEGQNAVSPPAQVERRILLTKYCEVRMLWCIGRDLIRWIEQCLDFVGRHPPLRQADIRFQSFSALLIEDTPGPVAEKLRLWGVADYRNIFARAIGMGTVFAELPALGMLSEDFLREYYSYTHQMYLCRQQACSYHRLEASEFAFEVYTSGEYIKIIERQMTGR